VTPGTLAFGDGGLRGRVPSPRVAISHVAEFAYLNMNKLKSTSGSGLYAEAEYDPRGDILQRVPHRRS